MNVDKTQEAVNHPDHYNLGGIEVIDAVEAWGFGEGFNRGNAIKYIARAGRKDPGTEIEDLKKAEWYIHREVKRLSGEDEVEDQKPHGRWLYIDRQRKYYRQYTGFDVNGEIHTITVLEESKGKEPYCSKCNAQAAESYLDYCPHCGAKMDLEEEHGSEYKD